MLEGVVSRNTHPLKSHQLLMTESLIKQKVHFWTLNGINGSLVIPVTKSVTKKQMNKCMAEIQDLDRKKRNTITSKKSQYHNH